MSKMTIVTRQAKVVAGFVLTAAFVALAAPAAFAQGQPHPAASNAAPEPKILVIDRAGVLRSSKVGQDMNRQAQGYVQAMESELKGEALGLQKEKAALQQQVAILAPDVRAQKIKAFDAKATAFQQKALGRREQIQYGLYLAKQQIDKSLGPIIQGVMQERGANLLLDRNAVIYGTGSFDISLTVVQRLDQKLPTLKLQLVTPPPQIAAQMQQQQQQQGQ
ncbi:MAG: OmpH family outer membrane protein [Rhizomicrobium sp.]|jgi:Skp family chaperone for outer membrane proteins